MFNSAVSAPHINIIKEMLMYVNFIVLVYLVISMGK